MGSEMCIRDRVPAAQAPTIGAAPSPARHAADRPITRAQFVDARVARLTALDADRDGAVSVAARLGERFDRLDADRDGVIAADERRAAMTARRAERQAARPAPQVASPAPASE